MKKIKVIKILPNKSWISQCVIIGGIAYNIGGWDEGIKRPKWADDVPQEDGHAYIMMRQQEHIPNNAPIINNSEIIEIRNRTWRVWTSRQRGVPFAWLASYP